MLLTIAFWLLILFDVGVLGLVFLLGLAAGPPSHTGPLEIAAFILVVPGLCILAAIALFHLASSLVLRGLAFVAAATPLLLLVFAPMVATWRVSQFRDASGARTHFRSENMQQLEAAIARDDATAVARLARDVNMQERSIDGVTPLTLALQRRQTQPGTMEVVRALLAAGADPNHAPADLPLTVAIRVGPEAVQVLLDAGANPNATTSFGVPIWFSATGRGVSPRVLPLLLERGADVRATSAEGRTALFDAVNVQNWPAVTLLLDRGLDWRSYRDLQGRDLPTRLAADAALAFTPKDGLDALRARVK